MKPRTVYEKAVQDFTETARQLARINQHFRQASFAEFEMLMGLDDEVLKRYGLPKPLIERALIEAYQRKAAQEKAEGLQRVGSLLGEFDSDCPAVYRAYEQKEDGKGGVILTHKTTGQTVHIQSSSRDGYSVNGTPMNKKRIVAWMMENMRRA